MYVRSHRHYKRKLDDDDSVEVGAEETAPGVEIDVQKLHYLFGCFEIETEEENGEVVIEN